MNARMKEALENHLNGVIAKGYCEEQILGVFAYGSQNYNFSHAGSDLDTKVIILPSYKDLVFSPAVSKEYHWENDEHSEVKDIREIVKMFYKQNINFLEILFTDYYLINSRYKEFWETRILPLREKIARYNVNYGIASVCGQAIHTLGQGEKTLDGKKFANGLRLYRYLNEYKKGAPYLDCIVVPNGSARDLMLRYKTDEATPEVDAYENLIGLFRAEQTRNSETVAVRDLGVEEDLNEAVADLIWSKILWDRSGKKEYIDFL